MPLVVPPHTACPWCHQAIGTYGTKRSMSSIRYVTRSTDMQWAAGQPGHASAPTASHLKVLLNVCNKFDRFLHRRLGHLRVHATRFGRAAVQWQQHPRGAAQQMCYIASRPYLDWGVPLLAISGAGRSTLAIGHTADSKQQHNRTMNSQTQVGRPSPPPTTFLPASTSGCAYSTSGWFSHSCTQHMTHVVRDIG